LGEEIRMMWFKQIWDFLLEFVAEYGRQKLRAQGVELPEEKTEQR
jgi:hypothetical protein